MTLDHKLAPVVRDYILSMENFCKRNFGTTDLSKCREDLEESYKEAWGK